MSQRYFLTAESTYEDLRQSLNAALAYPNSLGKSVFQTALYAPRDNFRRVLLAVDTAIPGYATVNAAIQPLLDSDAMEEIDEATYLAAVASATAGASAWNDITGKPSTFAPSAHAASHAAGGADQLFDQVLSTTNSPTFAGLQLNGGLLSTGSANFQTPTGGLGSGFVINPTTGALTWPDGTTQNTAGSAASHAHGSITNAGAIGTTSGLIVTTGASGVLGTLAQGTAGQVLKVNSGATGVEWGTAAADVSIDTTAADILSASSGSITADDPGADRLVFWDDSAGKLTHLTAGTGLSISGTTITASVSASDISAGTLAYARMADPTVTSPSQITASQNDYSGFARGINRFTTNAARDLTGMVAGSDGEVRVLTNVGTTAANTLTIKDESASSTAANRFSVPWNGDCVIPAEGSVVAFYDGTSQRWRVIA